MIVKTIFLLLTGLSLVGQDNESKRIRKLVEADRLYGKGQTALRRGNHEEARDYLLKSIAEFSDHSDSLFLLSRIQYLRQDYPLALRYVINARSSLAALNRTMAAVRSYRIARLKKWKEEEAASEMQKLRSIRKASSGCRGEFAEAEMTALKSQGTSPEDVGEMETIRMNRQKLLSYSYVQGEIHLRLGEVESARSEFFRALRIDSGFAEAYNGLAICAFQDQEFRQALFYLDQAHFFGGSALEDIAAGSLTALGKTESELTEEEFPGGIKQFQVEIGDPENRFLVNTYICFDPGTRDAVIIDPGGIDGRIEAYIRENRLEVKKILNTHGHRDHSEANRYFACLFKVKIAASERDQELYSGDNISNKPEEFFGEETVLQIGSLRVQVIPTPGHTPGSVCFLINGNLFSGDTLFFDLIGRAWGVDEAEMTRNRRLIEEMIRKKLFILPGNTSVYPGHHIPTTIKREKESSLVLGEIQLTGRSKSG